MEQKDGENHFMGVIIAPDGTLGTKDFFAKQGENGAFTGRSTYYFPKGTINVTMVGDGTGTRLRAAAPWAREKPPRGLWTRGGEQASRRCGKTPV
jgi:hypothetical protein